MSENRRLLRGRILSRLVDERFSPFLILSPTRLCPLEPKRKLPSGQRPQFPLSRFLNFFCSSKMISPLLALERMESGQNLSDSVAEQSSDFSVTQLLRCFFRRIPPPSSSSGRKATIFYIYIYISSK